jgi:hypothetical protein
MVASKVKSLYLSLTVLYQTACCVVKIDSEIIGQVLGAPSDLSVWLTVEQSQIGFPCTTQSITGFGNPQLDDKSALRPQDRNILNMATSVIVGMRARGGVDDWHKTVRTWQLTSSRVISPCWISIAENSR